MPRLELLIVGLTVSWLVKDESLAVVCGGSGVRRAPVACRGDFSTKISVSQVAGSSICLRLDKRVDQGGVEIV